MFKGLLGWVSASALVLVLGWSQAASASTVYFEDNFDSENNGVGAINYAAFEKWEVKTGTVDLIGNGYYDMLSGNGLYLDMDGTSGIAGSILSDAISLPEAGRYVLSFDLAGSQRNANGPADQVVVTVSLGGLFNETFTLPWNAPFTTITRTFTIIAPTGVRLGFAGIGGDNVGMLLDNVKVAAVPLPAAGWAGLGLLGILGIARIRRKRMA